MITETEVKRAEAAALLERRMAAMEAVLASRRNPPAQAVEPQAARGPGADLRFQVSCPSCLPCEFCCDLTMQFLSYVSDTLMGN